MRGSRSAALLLSIAAAACQNLPRSDQEVAPPVDPNPSQLPAEFAAGRIFVRPTTADGTELRLFTDTGGGLFVLRSAVERLGLETVTLGEGAEASTLALFPGFRPGASIPGIAETNDPRPEAFRGKLFVLPDNENTAKLDTGDGMLGAVWFAGRAWTIDYPGRRFLVHDPAEPPTLDPEHTVDLGFLVGEGGERLTHFPSIDASVDGEVLPFLLDTGATVNLTESAAGELGGGPPFQRATSFVTHGVFQRWRQAHPDWRIVENADRNVEGSPMIEVPEVDVAGHRVGPVWFTSRPDANFHEYMSRMMDRKVEGALGGSLLGYFVLTLDYPGARAGFERDSS